MFLLTRNRARFSLAAVTRHSVAVLFCSLCIMYFASHTAVADIIAPTEDVITSAFSQGTDGLSTSD